MLLHQRWELKIQDKEENLLLNMFLKPIRKKNKEKEKEKRNKLTTKKQTKTNTTTQKQFRFNKTQQLTWNDVQIEMELGRGAFGVVHKGKYKGRDVC